MRMIISVAAQKGWKISQLDVKSAFLQGKLDEDVYIEQPKGYVKKGKEQMVYKLHKALYGLKQALRAWFSRIEAYFLSEGFEEDKNEHTLFTKRSTNGNLIIVSLYVDDLIITGNDEKLISKFKTSMVGEFDMTDLGMMSYFFGIEVLQRTDGNFICQSNYAETVLRRFGIIECKPICTPIVPGSKIDNDKENQLMKHSINNW